MIKAVLFDLDGTLLDREASVLKFISNQYNRLNKWVCHIPKEQYINRFIGLDQNGYVWKDIVYQQFVQEFMITGLSPEDLLEDYVNQFKYNCIPFANLINMLDALVEKNFALGIITNGKDPFQMENIKSLGIEKYFKTILISESIGMKKPEPQIFEKALEILTVLPTESVFVGDHPHNDIKAAQRIGMKGIWKRNAHWDNVEADYIIDDLEGIPRILTNINR
ncbi:putative hydrolase of the HAD superfamily [Mesobacillus persicus]|uniref:Putative hydrolase of the HAD superfamily n=1 Tax=Mesobacillus persicus TaxID=930146 RepID=A0A1H8KV88_9BACI|nr:HAD family hydrolase [Mesobacillus persicus]SEN96822.1 putative hydrolase of the HAD superfamily [Mesobacillus persicus]